MNYLYGAYIATWAIHLIYLGSLVRGIARLRAASRELDRAEAERRR